MSPASRHPRTFPFKTLFAERQRRDVMNAFVVKLNNTLSGIIFGTYLGGAGSDQGNAIAGRQRDLNRRRGADKFRKLSRQRRQFSRTTSSEPLVLLHNEDQTKLHAGRWVRISGATGLHRGSLACGVIPRLDHIRVSDRPSYRWRLDRIRHEGNRHLPQWNLDTRYQRQRHPGCIGQDGLVRAGGRHSGCRRLERYRADSRSWGFSGRGLSSSTSAGI